MPAPVRGVTRIVWVGTTPTDAEVAAGDVWLDTATYTFKYCSSIGPVVWTALPATGSELTANKNAANGYAGLNSVSRITKGVDTTDDVIIDLATKGLVLKDTQGSPHYWRLSVSTLGVLVTTDLGTTKP
jgi:peptidoglycan hydrolase-like protein with peptidoglycan-binding domain